LLFLCKRIKNPEAKSSIHIAGLLAWEAIRGGNEIKSNQVSQN